jgi:hypothetical protein
LSATLALHPFSIFVVLPAALAIGLIMSFAIGAFLLLGRHPPTTIFLALGTLTGSCATERLARGWYYLGGRTASPRSRRWPTKQSDKNRCFPVSDE